MSSTNSPKVPRKKRRIEHDKFEDVFSEPEPPDSDDMRNNQESDEEQRIPPYLPTFNMALNLLPVPLSAKDGMKTPKDSDSSGLEFQPDTTTRKKHRFSRNVRNSKFGIPGSKTNKSEIPCLSKPKKSELPSTSKSSLLELPSTSKASHLELPSTSKASHLELPSTSKGSHLEHPTTSKGGKSFHKASKFTGSGILNKISQYFKASPESSTKVPDKPSTSTSCSNSNEKSTPKESNGDKAKRAFCSWATNCYGLFGESTNEDMPCYFDRLPVHVMETILCQIPILDLLEYRTVCSTWDNVIKDDSFVKWKKLYYGYKKKREDAVEYIDKICTSYELICVEDCFKVLIMFMSEDFGTKPSADMYECLSQCQNAVIAELVLAERFPAVLTKESKSWCILATAIWLSETVSDVLDLYEKLTALKSDCSLHDITNALYCIAAFLLHFTLAFKINQGLHYRLYSALYWIENALPNKDSDRFQKMKTSHKLPGQQSLHMYCETLQSNLTFEQLRILNHPFQLDHILKIVALAGTGKTTTLVHLAQLYPQVKFLTIMFNKSVCENAKSRFPPNVTCKTAHALAYSFCGKWYRFKLCTKIRPVDLVTELKHHDGPKSTVHAYARNVICTLEKFVHSADKEISLEHVPNSNTIAEVDKRKILKDSIQIWEKIIDKENKTVRITHDHYLKLYQLSNPKLDEYQCLMVDEAQDCNPAILDIMMSQNLPVILVGDPNQQIYGFRGAKNALQSVKSTHTYHLTKSFRFGPEISYIASCCLSVLKQSNEQTIVGCDKPSSISGTVEGQYAIIARTNLQLFNEVVRMCCHERFRDNEPKTVFGAFAGGLKSYGYDQVLDILLLLHHSSGPAPILKDKFISRFKSFKELNNYARMVEDKDLLTRLEIVNQHGESLPAYISKIKEKCNYQLHNANVVFSTAHKAKGLEFDTVCLTNDYPIVTGFESTIIDRRDFELSVSLKRSLSDDESNTLYVALTRAKKCLLLPEKLIRVLLTAQEKFEYPVSAKKALGSREALNCIKCHDQFKPHTVLVLKRRDIVMANGNQIHGGILCIKCATEPTVRPRVQIEPVIMYLDPAPDLAHISMACIVGPLPNDPPIERDAFGPLNEMDVVYIINVNL